MLSDSLKQAVVRLLESEFSGLEFKANLEDDQFVTIRPVWCDFGDVSFLEEGGQLVIGWGRFTHSHIDSYQENHSKHIDEILDLLRHQLSSVVDDKVAFWGQSSGGSGGFFFVDHVGSRDDRQPAHLWSGKLFSEPA